MSYLNKLTTHGMSTLVAPAIRRSLIPVAFDSPPTAAPERLILSSHSTISLSYPLNQSGIVVVWHSTAPVIVLDVEETFVASYAV